MKKASVLLLYNPAAGKRRVAQELEGIITGLSKEGCVVTACPILPGQTLAQDTLAQLANRMDGVVCCGGDGTLHHTVQQLMELGGQLPVGYLPFGSTNDFAASVQISPELAKNCAAIGRMQPSKLDLGRFGKQYFCYVAAFGMFTEVSYQTPQGSKNLMGHMAYVMEGIRTLDISKGWKARVEADGQVLEGEFWYGSLSNARAIGGMTVPDAEQVRMDDGLFELMLIRKPQTLLEMHQLAGSLLNQRRNEDLVHRLTARKVKVWFEQPTSWTLDGEEGPMVTQVELEVLPGKLLLLNGDTAALKE